MRLRALELELQDLKKRLTHPPLDDYLLLEATTK
jgi:hypothetical protein